jgi:UDP-glucose 4-epimerase
MFEQRRKILITGAAGFIGQHLLNNLINEEFDIHCIVRNLDSKLINKKFDSVLYYDVDLNNKENLNRIVKNISPDYVVHLAGRKSRSNELKQINSILENNINGTLNLFESLLGIVNLKRVTVLGTIEEYGFADTPFKENNFENPVSIYGVSKLSITKLSKIFFNEYHLPITILRPSLVYGPKQGTEMFISSIINTLTKQQLFAMTKGEQYRDFIFIEDLVEGIKKTFLFDDLSGLVINIASGKSYKLSEIANKIASLLNAENLLQIGAIEYRNLEIMNYTVDISLAAQKLKWQPRISIDTGLALTINSYDE